MVPHLEWEMHPLALLGGCVRMRTHAHTPAPKKITIHFIFFIVIIIPLFFRVRGENTRLTEYTQEILSIG